MVPPGNKGAWETQSLAGWLVCGIKGTAQILVSDRDYIQQLDIFPKPSLFVMMPFFLPRKSLPLPRILFLQLANTCLMSPSIDKYL